MSSVSSHIFVFNDPSDVDFAAWLTNALSEMGYSVVRSLEQSEVVLFVVTATALQSPWLDNFKRQIHQRRNNGELEIILGAVLRDDMHHITDSPNANDYDFVVDFRRNDPAAFEQLRRRIAGQPEGWLIERSTTKTAILASEAGVVNIHTKFPLDLYLEWLQQAQNRIMIHCTWSSLIEHSTELLEAVKRGTSVRFLLLAPDSPIAKQRTQDIFHYGEVANVTDEDKVSQFIRESIRLYNDLYAEVEKIGGAFELRLYESMPSFPIWVSDDRALVGFYPHSVRATEFAHVEIETDSAFGEQILGEFERIWMNARPHALPTPSEAAKEANEKLDDPLTATELRVLNLVCKGLSNQEIADQLVVQYSTIRAHKNHIYSKLGISSNPTLLIIRAQELGLVSR
jgi:DNA-binding CsgD family transcriptional regulator